MLWTWISACWKTDMRYWIAKYEYPDNGGENDSPARSGSVKDEVHAFFEDLRGFFEHDAASDVEEIAEEPEAVAAAAAEEAAEEAVSDVAEAFGETVEDYAEAAEETAEETVSEVAEAVEEAAEEGAEGVSAGPDLPDDGIGMGDDGAVASFPAKSYYEPDNSVQPYTPVMKPTEITQLMGHPTGEIVIDDTGIKHKLNKYERWVKRRKKR